MPKTQKTVASEADIIINEDMLRDKIYTIREQKVMLDYDLAKIYGYTTKAFNQQVSRNIQRFEGSDFMFQVNRIELDRLVKSQIVTSRNNTIFSGQSGGIRKLPYAFTEQGIYMLMTVLRGPLAIRQSRILIRLFKSMKDYILETNNVINYRESLKILSQVTDNTRDIVEIRNEIKKMDNEIKSIANQMEDTIKRPEISPLFLDFSKVAEEREFLVFDGQPARAAETFINIYRKANKNIIIIDDYINIKSLRLLQDIKPGIDITIFSDNVGNYLHKSDYDSFRKEFPGIEVGFITTNKRVHDRFVIIDYGLRGEEIYQCGASSKDAGWRMTTIQRIRDEFMKQALHRIIEELRNNTLLRLK